MTVEPLCIGLVAGEPSGDRLGAALINALKARDPGIQCSGMTGPKMRQAGCDSIADIEQLSVMGVAEVLKSYPRLRRLRNQLGEYFERTRPDVVVGIDVPDFNLGLEQRLKRSGIATVHYVCPQAWAWRPQRARKIRHSCDRLLALLPFEPEFFARYGVTTDFVGHPLADQIPLEPDRAQARGALGLPAGGTVMALMPGSRSQELDRLLSPFCAAANLAQQALPGLQVIICVARERDRHRAEQALGATSGRVYVARSQDVLTAADVAIVASGTVSLEAFFCATPTVVGYRLAPLSYHIIKRMVSIDKIALPNLLTGLELMPELIQDQLTPKALADAALAWLADADRRARYHQTSRQWHHQLRLDAGARAAEVVLELCKQRQ